MNLKLTKKQEAALVNLGLNTLLNSATTERASVVHKKKDNRPRKTSRKWSKAQHKKYAETMARKWDSKRK